MEFILFTNIFIVAKLIEFMRVKILRYKCNKGHVILLKKLDIKML